MNKFLKIILLHKLGNKLIEISNLNPQLISNDYKIESVLRYNKESGEIFNLYIPFNSEKYGDESIEYITLNLFNLLNAHINQLTKNNTLKRVTLSVNFQGVDLDDIDSNTYCYPVHSEIVFNKDMKFNDYLNKIRKEFIRNMDFYSEDQINPIIFKYTVISITEPKLPQLIGKVKNISKVRSILGSNVSNTFSNKRSIHTSSIDSNHLFYITLFKSINPYLNKEELKLLLRIINDSYPFEIEKIEPHQYQKNRIHFYIHNLEVMSDSPKDYFRALFFMLTMQEEFDNFSNNKLVYLTVESENGNHRTIHHTVLINKYTTFEDYWIEIKDDIQKNINDFYIPIESLINFKYTLINIDEEIKINPYLKVISSEELATKEHGLIIRDEHPLTRIKRKKERRPYGYIPLSINKINSRSIQTISPVTPNQTKISRFACFDIETVSVDNIQYPICITFYYTISRNKPIHRTFLIDYKLFLADKDEAVKQLWAEFFKFINHPSIYKFCKTIFAHNLGSFDGYFLYKALMNHYPSDNVSIVVDDQNKFVCLQLKVSDSDLITFKDSYRIFPVSLDNLCKSFDVDGKISKYNPDYNNIDIFKTQNRWKLKNFKDYALQDSRSLYNALVKAQNAYFDNFKVDITSIYSTSSLSLKIFRANFLKDDIAILSNQTDKFVRKAYLGGSTDYYKEYAQNVHYYDVNSLYPFAMKMELPNKPINTYKDMSDIKLENFYGFALAEIHCPDNILIPVLPYKDPDTARTIHPKGKWKAVYYSEELKAVSKLGYEIKLIEGTEFSKFRPFDEYIDHFYDLKKNSTGGTRFIAKMQLNQLYGVFGRKQELIKSVNTKEIEKFAHFNIKTIIDSGAEWSTILIVDRKLIDLTVATREEDKDYRVVKSNVAIAAAVTANARIVMQNYKLNAGNSLCYTDTDSIFTTKPLDSDLIGKELGLMKDELDGKVIDEAYFFGIKKYGYRINDKTSSVFAGIKRDSLTWNDILDIYNNKTVDSLQVNVFFKSLNSLNIVVKNRKIKVRKDISNIKVKEGNNYLPPKINNTDT